MTYDTVLNVVSDASVLVGLGEVTAVYAGTSANVVQLRGLLKQLGQRLRREFDWQALQKIHTLSTANGTASYALPADFDRMSPNSNWNRTQKRKQYGPASAGGWEHLKGAAVSNVVAQTHRVFGGLFYLDPTPTAIETVAYEYQSSYWVAATPGTTLSKEAPTVDTDVMWFDRQVLVQGLRSDWLRAKGFASGAADAAFLDALEKAKSADKSAPRLHLDGPRPHRENVPEGSWP